MATPAPPGRALSGWIGAAEVLAGGGAVGGGESGAVGGDCGGFGLVGGTHQMNRGGVFHQPYGPPLIYVETSFGPC